MKRVLIVATGRKTRGGITSVIKIHESMSFWKLFNCEWIETHYDGNSISKIKMFLIAFINFNYKIFSFQIVHFHLSWKISVLRKLPFILVSKLFNRKVIIHIHASAETTYLKHKLLFSFVFYLADKIVYIYPSFFSNVKHSIKKKSILIYNPILDNGYVNVNMKKNQVLFIGSLTEKKGVFDLIRAFKKVSIKNPDWSLKIAGVGALDNCKELVKKLDLENVIQFYGWVDGKQKQKLLQESKVFCLPSYTEGFPMSLIEAWQNKIVPVVSNVGGIPDVVINNKNGFLIVPGNINQLTEKLNIAFNNDDLCSSILLEGEKFYMESFEIKKLDALISDLYFSLV